VTHIFILRRVKRSASSPSFFTEVSLAVSSPMPENGKNKRTLISFDWALKSLLRQSDNFDILEGFLTALLKEDITILGLAESEANKDNEADKFNRVDLRAEDSKNREIIIEIQCDKEPDYVERVYYGAAKSLVNNMKEGYRYRQVKKIISISIVYFNFLQTAAVLKAETNFFNAETGEMQKNIDSSVFAEYYFIQPKVFDDIIKTPLDEWIYMFKYSDVKENFTAKNIQKAKNKLAYAGMTAEEQQSYDAFELNKTIVEGVLDEKRLEGRLEGIVEGELKGELKGKREVAENLLKMGLTAEQVSQGTELYADEVREIMAKLQLKKPM
jgi:predicted transposase/invertase (TIGR01784 family)